MSIGVTDRVVTGLAVADVARWRLDSSAGTELSDPQQVVGGADQVGGETGPFDAPIARATEVADGLDPAEDLFDPLAHALADCVARPIVVRRSSAEPPGRRSFCATWGVTLSARQLATNAAVS